MRKYYLFVIRKDVYEVYKNNPFLLYQALRNLYHLKSVDFTYGISFFFQLCEIFHVERLERYLEEKYYLEKTRGVYRVGDDYVWIRPSRCIIKTRVNMPNLFIDFKCYNRLIFAIDFDMGDYFFLCQDYNIPRKMRIG